MMESVWPDSAKLCQFSTNLEIFGNKRKVYFIFGKVVNSPWDFLYAFGQNFIIINGQILKNNIAIWSHWAKIDQFFPKVASKVAALVLT